MNGVSDILLTLAVLKIQNISYVLMKKTRLFVKKRTEIESKVSVHVLNNWIWFEALLSVTHVMSLLVKKYFSSQNTTFD